MRAATEIRPATKGDAEAIADIYNQIIRDTTITFAANEKTPADIAEQIKTACAYLVAHRGAEILGFASFGPFRAGPGYGRVKEHSICLAQAARGSGLGRHLMAALEDEARQQGVEHMIAGVSGENMAGQKFHAQLGYKQVGHLPGIGQKFGRHIDLVLMQKAL